MTAREIAHRTGGEVVGDADAVVTSWAFDSRDLVPGAGFVALAGERDGHDFVEAAFRAGARVALVSRVSVPDAGTLVRVADPLAALQALARGVRQERTALRVVGVAGSTGKTSTKDLLAGALASRAVHANPASYNNEFGLPVALLNAGPDVDIVVAEMGERFPGDVAALCEIARPDVGVVTNVGLAHAEHLGGILGAAAAFGELLEALPATGYAVLNADDEHSPLLAAQTPATVVTVGCADNATVRISDVTVTDDLRPAFTLDGHRFDVPLRGVHQVQNAALAAVVAHEVFGVDWVDIATGLRSARASRWRMEVTERRDGAVVLNDAYNANPDSMDAALRALAQLAVPGRRVAILGDMRELGEYSDAAHERVGTRAAELGVDVVVGVGAGGKVIADAARAGGVEAHTAATAPDAQALASKLVGPGDAVLVKASRALGLQTVAHTLLLESAS